MMSGKGGKRNFGRRIGREADNGEGKESRGMVEVREWIVDDMYGRKKRKRKGKGEVLHYGT